jgi:hypothetical protein
MTPGGTPTQQQGSPLILLGRQRDGLADDSTAKHNKALLIGGRGKNHGLLGRARRSRKTETNIRTVPGEWSLGSLLGPHIGQLCLAQIEFPLDSAPRFIFQLAVSIQLIDLRPFGFD